MSARQRSPKKNFPRGSGSSSINNRPPSTRGPAGERGAQQERSKKNAPGVVARTGIKAGPGGSKGDPTDKTGGADSSSIKNHPRRAGLVARTGVRAGEGRGKETATLGDGRGASSVKNYPSNARAAVVEK